MIVERKEVFKDTMVVLDILKPFLIQITYLKQPIFLIFKDFTSLSVEDIRIHMEMLVLNYIRNLKKPNRKASFFIKK